MYIVVNKISNKMADPSIALLKYDRIAKTAQLRYQSDNVNVNLQFEGGTE